MRLYTRFSYRHETLYQIQLQALDFIPDLVTGMRLDTRFSYRHEILYQI